MVHWWSKTDHVIEVDRVVDRVAVMTNVDMAAFDRVDRVDHVKQKKIRNRGKNNDFYKNKNRY